MRYVVNIIKVIFIITWALTIYYTTDLSVLSIALSLLLLIAADMIHTLLHEMGHLIGGLSSDYHFLSLHIGPLEIRKKTYHGKGLVFSININEVYDQCLMIPNEANNKFILYNLTGVIFNLLMVLASIFMILRLEKGSFNFIFFLSLTAIGLNKTVSNAIPYCRKRLPNDLMIIIWLAFSQKTRLDYFEYLRAYENKVYGFPIETGSVVPRFIQKDIDHYNPFFAQALSQLAGLDTAIDIIKNP